eukprot:Amastigsp_a509146_101.p4 type:complete len:113 gc:universal Amastigsp_a509146_101:1426-1764(+)
MRASVHDADSPTSSCASFMSCAKSGMPEWMSSLTAPVLTPERIEPNAKTAASRARQLSCTNTFVRMKSTVCPSTSSPTVLATRSSDVPAAMLSVHAPSSWWSSCRHIVSRSI